MPRMTWNDIVADWTAWSERFRMRYPQLETKRMDRARHDRAAFEAYLARAHNLSLTEAHEEIDDLLYIETLAREIAAQPAHVQ